MQPHLHRCWRLCFWVSAGPRSIYCTNRKPEDQEVATQRRLLSGSRRGRAKETSVVQPGLFGIRRMNRPRLTIGIILALASLFPLLYMVSLSFQPNGGILG